MKGCGVGGNIIVWNKGVGFVVFGGLMGGWVVEVY